ncbi:transducin beta-like protein 2 [Sycon ciliatum]|uniref:transducin beta-like protein 2 n=1 Tax=Sycon ciliatum TaxID=27933 RepID=UPI0020AD7D69|eukprot:scpid68067/ scgid12569/ Transducin beta-like protein 2; WS beta-transducin repeats protein; Williams-Beuren syndrome chromosomal region 13 protein
MESSTTGVVIGTFILAIAIYVLISLFKGEDKKDEDSSSGTAKKGKDQAEKPKAASAAAAAGGGKKKLQPAKLKKIDLSSHPCLAADLRGHTAPVLGLSVDPSGDYLASCSEDRTIRIWYSNDFSTRDHRYHRINVELDHAKSLCFSPDSRALVTALDDAQAIRVFKLNRKKDGTVQGSSVILDLQKVHSLPILNVAIASTGKFMLTASSDNKIVIWTPKGDVLESIDTRQVTTHWAAISPCGRFIASAGFTSDVKIWEVKFSKSGEFLAVNRAMELKGHTSAVYHFSFSADSKRMATVSKDGHFKVWDIDVNFELRQDPKLLTDKDHFAQLGSSSSDPMLAAISPDATTVAVASDRTVSVYRADGTDVNMYGVVHGADITSLAWHPDSRLLCSAGADKRVCVWHNLTGMQANIEQLTTKIRSTRADTVRTRLQGQLDELKTRVDDIQALRAVAATA